MKRFRLAFLPAMASLVLSTATSSIAQNQVQVDLDAGGAVYPFFSNSSGTATNDLTLRIGTFNSATDADVQALGYNLLWVGNQFTVMTPGAGTVVTKTINSQAGSYSSDGTNDAAWTTSSSSALNEQIWLVYSDSATLSSSTVYGVASSTNALWDMPASYSAGTTLKELYSSQIDTVAYGSTSGSGSTGTIRTAAAPATYLYWDSNGAAGLGGDGTWSSSTSDTEWTTDSAGSATDGPYAWGTTSGTTFYAGAGLTANFTGTAGTVTVSGTVQAHAGMEFHTTGYTLSSGTINLAGSSAATNEITVSTGTATISSVLTGSNGFQKYGTGTLTLSGANTYSGGTTMDSSSGTININNATAIGTGALTIAGSGTTIDNTSGGAITLSNNNNIALSGGSLTFTGTNDLSFGTGVVTLSGATSRTMTVNGGSLTVGSIDANATNRALVKAGSGTLLISGSAGANFQAGTTISGGTLTIGHQSALGTGAITIGSGTLTTSSSFTGASAVTNSIVIDSASAAIAGANNLELSGSITNSGGGRTLLINKTGSTTLSGSIFLSEATGTGRTLTLNTATDVTASGVISNFSGGAGTAGNLIKQGAGTLILTNANTYTGTTTISAGILQIGNGGTTGALSSSSTITNNAGLVFNQTDTVTQGTDFANNIGGSGTLTQNGSGTLALNTSNSYTGATTINAGIIRASNATALGTTAGGVTVASGAALELTGGITVGAEALNLSGSGISSGGALRNISGDNTYGGAITLAAASRINSDAGLLTLDVSSGSAITGTFNLTMGGAGNITVADPIGISTGTLTMDGTGTLILSANSTYTGATTISSGTLQLGTGGNTGNITSDITNNSALLINRGNNFTYGNVISGTGSLTKEGAGALTLSGINTFSGTTTINGGSIRLGGAASSDTLTGNIVVNTGGTLDYSNSNDNQIKNTAFVTIAGGTFDAGARAETIAGLTITSGTFTKASNSGGTFSLSGSLTMSGGNLSITSSGTVALGAASTISSGTVTLSHASARINTTGTTTLGTSTFSYNNASVATQGIVLSGDFLVNNSSTVDFTNAAAGAGRITLGGASRVFDVGSSANMNVGWVIDSSSTSGALTKAGAGTLTLSSANTYTGATTVNLGTLSISDVANGGSASNIGQSTNSAANLVLGGGTLLFTGATDSTDRNFTLTAATTSTIDVSNGATTLTISGAAANTNGSLTKAGAGTLSLTAQNLYTGTTTVSAGILSLGHATNTLSNSSSVVVSGGTLALGANTDTVSSFTMSSGEVSGGTLTATTYALSGGTVSGALGAGTATVSGGVSLTGTMASTTLNISNGGNLTLGSANRIGDSTNVDIASGGVLTLNGNSDTVAGISGAGNISLGAGTLTTSFAGSNTLSGQISGSGGLTKEGTGTLVLSGSNTYTGTTTINGGTINAAHASALGSTSGVTVNNGGSLLVSADDAINGDAITLASTSTTVAGLAFSGTYANTSGQAGTLTLSQNSIIDLGTGSVTIHFSSITGLDTYTLAIYNWTGTTLWDGGTGNNTDQFYSNGAALTQSQLNRISFYSGGLGTSSFVGSGYQIIGGSFANQVIPVPEPEVYATAALLLLGLGFHFYRQRRRAG